MIVKTVVVGSYAVNCYVAGCEEHKKAVVIDPGDEPEKIIHRIKDDGVTPVYIINTHGHADHIGGVSGVKKEFPIPYMIHTEDLVIVNAQSTKDMIQFLGASLPPAPDTLITEEMTLELCCNLKINILHIPGHSPGGISLLINGCLFTGDSLFAGSIGRTDFPLSSHDDLISSIQKKIVVLDDAIKVYPGHGHYSTIGNERKSNPFLMS